MFDQKVAGRVKFGDVTLEKGVLQDGSDKAALDWVKQLVDANAVTGKLPAEYMRDAGMQVPSPFRREGLDSKPDRAQPAPNPCAGSSKR